MFDEYINKEVPDKAIEILEEYADDHNMDCRWMDFHYLELMVIEKGRFDLSFCIDIIFEGGTFLVKDIHIQTYDDFHSEVNEEIFSAADYEKVKRVGQDFLKLLFG